MSEGRIRLGEYAQNDQLRCAELATLFSDAGVPCEASDDLERIRWEKLVWNIPFNGLCALTGKDVTELLQHSPTRELIASIMHEVVLAANLQDLKAPIDGDSFITQMLSISDNMDHYRPSMMIDRLEQHPLELEAIYEIPLQRAAQAGAAMHQVDMLHRLLTVGEI